MRIHKKHNEVRRPTNFEDFTLENDPNISSRANRLYKTYLDKNYDEPK